MRFLIFILLCCIVASLCSCSKVTDYSYLNTDRRTTYKMIVDWYPLDTSGTPKRYTQDLGELVPKEAIKIDTASDLWFIDCNMREVLQHLYYTKNGIKIQPSKYPK